MHQVKLAQWRRFHEGNTVPLKLIALLANGEFHSGEQLGESLGMSRAAINKHIQTLRDWGVDVFTVPGKGYSLPEPIQLLNAEQILGQLDGGSVTVLPVIDSTNQYLLDRIGELKSAMPVLQNTSRLAVVAGVGNGFRLLAQTYICRCSGVWNKARRRRLV